MNDSSKYTGGIYYLVIIAIGLILILKSSNPLNLIFLIPVTFGVCCAWWIDYFNHSRAVEKAAGKPSTIDPKFQSKVIIIVFIVILIGIASYMFS